MRSAPDHVAAFPAFIALDRFNELGAIKEGGWRHWTRTGPTSIPDKYPELARAECAVTGSFANREYRSGGERILASKSQPTHARAPTQMRPPEVAGSTS
jgi:hypothetical protein